ncbi:MAG: alpha/beta fold hydrolase [Parvibaculaceae bacterium]
MFEEFTLEHVELSDATLRVRWGGAGQPILLLHGHPRTHATWDKVATRLAQGHTVVCPDLRGFGRSSIPADTSDHSGSSKRAKAKDCVELMQRFGFGRFAIVGHDRGAYTAFRAAMDWPDAISHLAVLDAVPILEALERCDTRFATRWWHWFFFGQADKPERAISADPEAWYAPPSPAVGEAALADWRAAIHDPAVVHGMIEDYRAGLTIDPLHDAEDRAAGRRVRCPTLALWSEEDDLPMLYGDVLAVWRPWAADLRGRSFPCGHHMSEEIPELLADVLADFVG